MTDLLTALYAHSAILTALLQREQCGLGQWVQCDLLSSQVSAMTHLASNWLNCGVESGRWGTAHPSIVPYQVPHCTHPHCCTRSPDIPHT